MSYVKKTKQTTSTAAATARERWGGKKEEAGRTKLARDGSVVGQSWLLFQRTCFDSWHPQGS